MADIKPIVGGAGSSQFRQLQAGDFLVGNTPTAGDNSTKYATTAFVAAVGGGGITDAPSDGNTYGRKDGAWVAVGGGGGNDPPILISTNSTLGASHIDRIVEWTGGTGTLILSAGIGATGSLISIVNNSGYALTLQRASGVSIWRYGVNQNIEIPARRILTIYRSSTSNVWYTT